MILITFTEAVRQDNAGLKDSNPRRTERSDARRRASSALAAAAGRRYLGWPMLSRTDMIAWTTAPFSGAVALACLGSAREQHNPDALVAV